MLQGWDPTWTVRRFDAAAAIDAADHAYAHASGVSAVVERQPDGTVTLAAIGPTAEIASSSRWRGVETVDMQGHLLTPGLVNAHTHLDLTHIGPRPHDPAEGFAVWINMILRERLTDAPAIAGAVQAGVTRLLAGGTVLVGDIAGAVGGRASPAPGRALAEDGRINGVSYVEFFAQGAKGQAGVEQAIRTWEALDAAPDSGKGRVAFGIQPHAPYSVGSGYYEKVLSGVSPSTPFCTHLSESLAEHEFIARGSGPFRALLERLDLWDPLAAGEVGHALTPIAHMQQHLAGGRQAVVHCNDVWDEDLLILARTSAPVLYCPRSSSYFGAHQDFGPHRYREMLNAGVTVALGTDSIVNLNTPGRISVWDEMRFLHQRDGTEPIALLQMATTAGAKALRRAPEAFTLTSGGTIAGLLAIPVPNQNQTTNPSELLSVALRQALPLDTESDSSPNLLLVARV